MLRARCCRYHLLSRSDFYSGRRVFVNIKLRGFVFICRIKLFVIVEEPILVIKVRGISFSQTLESRFVLFFRPRKYVTFEISIVR